MSTTSRRLLLPASHGAYRGAMTTIAEMAAEDRPRERLLRLGPHRLKDAEVLALLIGSGSRGASAVDLAARILKFSSGPRGLKLATAAELAKVDGVGPALAARIVGAMELARRAEARTGRAAAVHDTG